MDEKTSTAVSKKQTTKGQAITIMVVGGFMLLMSIVIPTERPSTAYTIKIVVGILGICVLCLGAYLRPMKPPENPK